MTISTTLPPEASATRLVEASFADLITAVEGGAELSEQCRRHWTCSLRQVAKWLGRPLEVIPARWQAIRLSVGQLHQARVGVTIKTLANHRSNVRAALRWYSKEQGVPRYGARLSPEWARIRDTLDERLRERLYSLIRYCSARRIGPISVNDEVFAEYWDYRTKMTRLASNNTARRFMVRAWNAGAAAMAGLPLHPLTEPPVTTAEHAWEKFPLRLRQEIESYLAGLAKVHRTLTGKRIQPCSASTIKYRRAELVAMARMAVKLGVPIESLTGLGALLHPDVVEPVLAAYWRKNGDEPKTGTIQLGWKLLRMAQTTGCLDGPPLERLDDMRAALEERRREGMTPKNLALIRQVLSGGLWSEVVSLPKALMRQARLAKEHAPVKAAVMAQLAAAIAIETFAPVRLRNLIHIEIGKNLIKPGGLDTPSWLTFPDYDVKNKVSLNFRFDAELTDLLDEYVHDFRPVLLRGSNGMWLFPGENGEPKNPLLFSKQITERIQKAIGLRITVHQFRHAAAAIYLKHHPGDYETVRRLLGHKSATTTIKFYCGLETIAATEQFGRLIREQINFDDDGDR
jgi:integrase